MQKHRRWGLYESFKTFKKTIILQHFTRADTHEGWCKWMYQPFSEFCRRTLFSELDSRITNKAPATALADLICRLSRQVLHRCFSMNRCVLVRRWAVLELSNKFVTPVLLVLSVCCYVAVPGGDALTRCRSFWIRYQLFGLFLAHSRFSLDWLRATA